MTSRSALAALILLGGAAPSLADAGSEALVRDFVAWVDSSPDWTAALGAVASQGDDTVARNVVFSRADPQVSVAIDTLRLAGLAERAGGGFIARALEIEDAIITSTALNYTIPSASVEAVSVPSMTGITFDPRRMMTFFAQAYTAMAQAEFSNLNIPEAAGSSQVQAEPGKTVSTRYVYRNLTIDELKNGVMQRMSAGPMTIATTQAEGEVEFNVASATSDRMDLGAFAHVFDPAQYEGGRGDRVWRPIISNITYSGISGSGPEGLTFSLDSFAMENLDGRQLDEPFTSTWDQLMDMTVAEERKGELALDLLRSYGAWRLGTFRMSGLEVGVLKEATSVSLNDITVSGMSSEGVDSFLMNGLNVETPDAFVALGSMELAGFASPDVEAFIQFAALESDVDPQAHADAIRKTFAALPRLDRFGMKDLAAGETRDLAVSIESVALDFRDWNEFFAGSTDIVVDGLKIPGQLIQLEGDSAEMWRALGYGDVVLGMSLADRWSPAAGTDEATWVVSMQDAGELQFSYRINGVTPEWIISSTATAGASEDNGAAMMAMLSQLSLQSATLSVTDNSLLDRGFAVAAQKQGLDVNGPTYREQMKAALPFILSAALPPNIVKLLSSPLQEFLSGGRKLVAEMVPPSPVSLPNLMAAANDVMALPERLNMTLRTEAAE
jgi:hypothetical protein